MSNKYTNFVSATSSTRCENLNQILLSGEEAAKLYLEEIKEVKNTVNIKNDCCEPNSIRSTKKLVNNSLSQSNLFLTVQNNDVNTLRDILNSCPDKINLIDEFGWSLLMIACQANAIEIVEELLTKGADTSIRDKAGNSAQSLVIKNKNYILADLLLSHIHNKNKQVKNNPKEVKSQSKEFYLCNICNKTFPDKEEHLSSTLHNIVASKDKKIKPSYAIPQSNKGFQIMLKGGWDKNKGLGPDGLGKQYPIKTVQKNDKKGLGHNKRQNKTQRDTVKHKNRKTLNNNYHDNRKFEIKFRREFY